MTGSPILMPKLGLTMTEGLLSSWLVAAGDEVVAGDVLFVVETDKIATEIVAQGPGRIIELRAREGETVDVGATVATWTGNPVGAEADPKAGADTQEVPAEPVAPSPGVKTVGATSVEVAASAPSSSERIVATPLARRIARQHGVDLAGVVGTGPRGRIKAADVLAGDKPALGRSSPRPQQASRPARPIEQTVARRLTEAKRNIPHFYVAGDADVTRLLGLVEELNADTGARRLTLTHFIIKAVALAMRDAPDFNVLWDDGSIVTPGTVDIGMAVDTERGLLVPVLRGVEGMSLDMLAQTAGAMVKWAREGGLTQGDMEGGVISVSNVGMFGSTYLMPIINPGQSSILGVAGIKPVFRPDDRGDPVLRREMGLALACDHRVLDGVKAAKFLNRIIEHLGNPLTLLRG